MPPTTHSLPPSALIEIAAVLTSHAGTLLHTPATLSPSAMDQYWVASKCRLDRWLRILRTYRLAGESKSIELGLVQQVQAVIEEVFQSEVLTRVWVALASAADDCWGVSELEPPARSIFIGHLEARNQVQQILLKPVGLPSSEVRRLNELRRRTERWTDLLIGHLLVHGRLAHFACDPDRAQEFADDLREQQREAGAAVVWPVTLASLRLAFQQPIAITLNGDLNAQIASSILSCFGSELFDSFGCSQSLWLLRMSNVCTDAEGMLEELLTTEVGPRGVLKRS